MILCDNLLFVGRLLFTLPLYHALLIASIVIAGFALWTLLFYHQKKSVQFIRSGHLVSKTAVHSIEVELWKATDKLITCQLHGRLGNMMFAYASLVGIAWKSGRTPALPVSHFLRSVFHIRAAVLPQRSLAVIQLSESRAGAYNDQLKQFRSDKELLELVGYFQSWRYFVNIEREIHAEFTFRRHLAASVDTFIQSAINENYGPLVHRRDVTLIGIHVRVTDMTADANVERGYSIATPDYFTAAMQLYQHRFPRERLLYILATDDENWCRNNFPYKSSGKSPIVHTAIGPAVQNLAVLASCNHTIISIGSFGWWAAWLSNGTTVYYKNFPRLNSSLADEYVLKDYYPDKWIAI